MKFEHIKTLLQLSCDFNTSSISHSFTMGKEDVLRVNCIKETYILEVRSSATQQIDYYTSIDEAAKALYEKIHSEKAT